MTHTKKAWTDSVDMVIDAASLNNVEKQYDDVVADYLNQAVKTSSSPTFVNITASSTMVTKNMTIKGYADGLGTSSTLAPLMRFVVNGMHSEYGDSVIHLAHNALAFCDKSGATVTCDPVQTAGVASALFNGLGDQIYWSNPSGDITLTVLLDKAYSYMRELIIEWGGGYPTAFDIYYSKDAGTTWTLFTAVTGWNNATYCVQTPSSLYTTNALKIVMHAYSSTDIVRIRELAWTNYSSPLQPYCVQKAGDTMLGALAFATASTKIYTGSGNSVKITTPSGFVDIGPQNTGLCHFSTDRAQFYFAQGAILNGGQRPYTSATFDLGLASYPWRHLYISGNISVGGTVDGVDVSTFKTLYDTHSHDFSSVYSAIDHTHDYSSVYAPLSHNHDSLYSALGHNHDAAYSVLSHTHDYVSLSNKPTLGSAAAMNTGSVAGTVAVGDHAHATYSQITHTHDYASLSNKPTLGTAAALNTGTAAGTVALGNHGHDGVYAPTHSHPYSLNTHDHAGVYEPSNSNIQAHISSASLHVPSMVGHGGYYLTTDGTTSSWGAPPAGALSGLTVDADKNWNGKSISNLASVYNNGSFISAAAEGLILGNTNETYDACLYRQWVSSAREIFHFALNYMGTLDTTKPGFDFRADSAGGFNWCYRPAGGSNVVIAWLNPDGSFLAGGCLNAATYVNATTQYQLNGTTIIDASKNIVANNITAGGALRCNVYGTNWTGQTVAPGFRLTNGHALETALTTVNRPQITLADENVYYQHFISSHHSVASNALNSIDFVLYQPARGQYYAPTYTAMQIRGDGILNVTNGIEINSTTVIDSGRCLRNIGRYIDQYSPVEARLNWLCSGANAGYKNFRIGMSGAGNNVFSVQRLTDDCSALSATLLEINGSSGVVTCGTVYTPYICATNVTGQLRSDTDITLCSLDGSVWKAIKTNGYYIETTQVIDGSRNVNATGVTASSITCSGAVNVGGTIKTANPGFRAYHGTYQSIGTSVVILTMSTETGVNQFDVGGNHSNGTFVTPMAGIYMFSAQLSLVTLPVGGTIMFEILDITGGAVLAKTVYKNTGANIETGSVLNIAAVAAVASGSSVACYASASSAVTSVVGAGVTWFSGYMLGRT